MSDVKNLIARLRARKPKAYEQEEDCSCGAAKGQLHQPGCDMEQCPLCGLQATGCAVHYYPEAQRMPYDGLPRGSREAIRLGFFAKLVPGQGWVACGPDDPEAWPDLNRLYGTCTWDAEAKLFKPQFFATFDEYVKAFPEGESFRRWLTNDGQRDVVLLLVTGPYCKVPGGYYWAHVSVWKSEVRVLVHDADDSTLSLKVADEAAGRAKLDELCQLAPYESHSDFMSLDFSTE